jgi:hypothetical protein
MLKRLASASFGVALLLSVVSACSSSQQKAINEAVARNTIAVAGAKQFRDSSHSLDGTLDCKVKSKTTTRVTVGCSGKTDKGEPVALLGTTSDARQVKGTFVGTVAGKQAFKTSCLGC